MAAQAGAASAGSLRTGFLDPSAAALPSSGSGSIPGFPIQNDKAALSVKGAGGSIVRLYAFWRRLAPTAPNVYDWTDLDRQVNAAVGEGLDVMLTLRSAPDWAQQHNCSSVTDARGACRPDPQEFHDFAHDIATHYSAHPFGGHVKYYGLWNEPNLSSFLAPQYVRRNGKKTLVSPDLYRKLLNRGARAVHEVNPNLVAVGGETAPFGHPNSPAPLLFLRKLLCVDNKGKKTCSKSRVEADVWATHPYTSGNPWHHGFGKDDVSFGDLGQWKKLVKGAARSRRFLESPGNIRRSIRLWNTEFSWDTKPPDDKGVPMKLHARWTAESLYRTWSLGIETLFWLQLRDYPVGDFYQSGLYRYKNSATEMGAAKLSLTAFRFPFVAYASRGRIKVWGRTPDSDAHTVKIERRTSGGGWHVVKTVSASGSGIFKKKWSSGDKTGKYRARLANTSNASVAFSLVRPRDKFVNPFGGA